MIKTIVWFTCGGLFTACFNNAVRNFPLFKRPSKHVLFMLVGLGLGYKAHMLEESAPELYKELIKKHKNAPWYEKGVLLAEREARIKALEAGDTQEDIPIEDEFVDVEDEDDD